MLRPLFIAAVILSAIGTVPAGKAPALAQAAKETPAKSSDAQLKPGAKKPEQKGRPTFVTLDEVVRGQKMETFPVYGRVVALQSGVVASRVRGAVGEAHVHVGSRVAKGDPLVALLTDTLAAERALKVAERSEFEARIRTSEAQLRLAEQELQRIERLRSSAAFSAARYEDKRREVERFRSALSESTARLRQAEAELDIAEINLRNAVIRAPYAGVVTQRHTDVGAFLNVGDRVVSMTNDTQLEIEAEVPSARLRGIEGGVEVTVAPETGGEFRASVRAIVPEENQLSRTRTVRFEVKPEGRPEHLAANQSVILRVPTGKPRVVTTAHKDALLHRRGETVMYVFADGKVAPRTVVLGDAFGSRFEIVSGLRPGDKVVIRGNERLRPGQEVQIRRKGPPASGKDAAPERKPEPNGAKPQSSLEAAPGTDGERRG